jgi:hypothetical protein
MATFTKFNSFVEDLSEKVHNLGADSLRVYLTNATPVATNTVYNTPADLTTGGGYTATGTVATITSSSQTSGTYRLVLADVVFTATTGFGPFRYAVLYNDTAASKQLIGFWDYGSAVTLGALETFTWDADPANGVLTLV